MNAGFRGPKMRENEGFAVDISPDRFEKLGIDDLYKEINNILDSVGMLQRFRKNIAFKTALVMGWLDAIKVANELEGKSFQEINSGVMEAEGKFLDKLSEMGVYVDVQSELSFEELEAKPQLFLSTHQGGGLETYLLAELLRRAGVQQFRYVMKDSNVKLPLVGKTIASRAPILVYRDNLKEDRQKEIEAIATEIVNSLANGENVLFFFEGTRSKNGLIAHTERRQEWGTALMEAIEKSAKDFPELDYGKVLVVLNMLSVLPNPVERNPFAKVRTNGDCTATMIKADNLRFVVDKDNMHDETTVFGVARAVLKQNLIQQLERIR